MCRNRHDKRLHMHFKIYCLKYMCWKQSFHRFGLKWNCHSSVLVVAVYMISFYSFFGSVQSMACSSKTQKCNLTECEMSTECKYSELDSCKCCKICIRTENQSCGGLHGREGICGDGLVCIISAENGLFINGTEAGICKDPTSSCPELSSYFGCTISQDECHCMNITTCNRPTFHYASREDCELVLSSRMTIGLDCMNVSCPFDDEICAADSYKLPSVFDPLHCCPIHQGCACLPTSCKPRECPEGKHPKILKHGIKKPGLCCSIYECVSSSELECEFNGKIYSSTDIWQADKCTVCSCRNGIIFCQPAKCSELPFCGLVSVPKGECCAVCSGCLSPSGRPYNNSDSWMENDCMTCHCVSGQVKCQEQMCQHTCENPQKIPGYCCPVCSSDSTVLPKEKCPSLTHCNLTCPSRNLLKDMDGCSICECQRQSCPSMDSCKKECNYGYVTDKSGCPRCKCKKCPSTDKCSKLCPLGFDIDHHGCLVCECKDKPTSTENHTSILQPCWMNGKMRYNGEYWKSPPCFNCTCYEGHVTCFQEPCPPLSCLHTVMDEDHCCPVCFESKQLNGCKYEENFYNSGEQWIIDDCTHCTCKKRQVMCTEKICPHMWCNQLINVPGQCCPFCADHSERDTEFSFITVLTSAAVIILLLLIVGLLAVVIKKQRSAMRCSSPAVTTRPKSVNLELQGAARFDNSKVLFGTTELKKFDNVPIITTVNNMV